MDNPFVHLHLHSEFSLLDGAIKINDLPKVIKAKGMDAVAITDHGAMYGVVDFYKACKKEGVKPIIGCEVYLSKDRHRREVDDERYHLILLAENNIGYHNLIKIVSKGYTEGFYYKPRIDKEVLMGFKEGIIATSACMAGEIPTLIRKDNYQGAVIAAKEYLEIFGKSNFFIEIQDHLLEEEKFLNSQLIKLSRELEIPLVAANDSHYVNKEDAFSHEVLMCIQMGKTIKDEHRLEFPNSEFYIKSSEEMWDIFKDIPSAIENTIKIKDRCNVEFKFDENHLPSFIVPEGETLDSYLKQLCYEGARKKYSTIEGPVEERLEYELAVISKMGYPGYFLIVWDMIKYAKENDIYVGPGRGSAAGSIVAYSLDITTIDPIKYDLLFERFLNPERVSLPDIDTDFCYVRRGEVISYLVEKYGHDKVAQIVTFGTMAARAAIRDVGRALDIPLSEVDKIAKLIPNELKITLESAIEKSVDLKDAYTTKNDIKKLIDIAMKLEGMPRHSSTHAAAVVISPGAIDNFLPIKIESEGNLTTQYTMTTVEELGLLKMDLLGLRTLTVIGDAVKKIKENRGIDVDIETIPLDDQKTYDLLSSGKTSGLFQLESKGMQNIIRNLKPDNIDDIIALVALYRPGPIGSGMIDDFVNRKHGKIELTYLHPLLEPILKDTYGVILYQEQVMRIAKELAGFTLGEADNLRKAMGKKNAAILEKNRQQFLDGCKVNNINEKLAEEIFTLIEYFAGYGFNKSHSAAYGILAYQTAYLKANYREEFMASLLSSVIMSFDKVNQYIADCKKIGVKVLPPDVNESFEDFSVRGNTIRFGLSAIKNIGYNSITTIIEERKNGQFKDIDDFCRRVDLKTTGKKVIESLVYSGAFLTMGYTRKGLLLAIDSAYDKGINYQRDLYSNQVSLFDLEDFEMDSNTPTNVGNEEFPIDEILLKEKEILGFYISGHPLAQFEVLEKVEGFTDIVDIDEDFDNRRIVVRGVLENLKERKTKKNDLMATFNVEDEIGSLEVVAFPRIFTEAYNLMMKGKVILVAGRMQVTERDTKILAEKIVAPNDWLQIKDYLKKQIVKNDNCDKNENPTIEVIINDKMNKREKLISLKEYIVKNKGDFLVRLFIENKEYNLGANYLLNDSKEVIEYLKTYGEVVVK
ncbi:MAG: DNA polymerase III subunit alpha [Firmicutes bacterium]|nr:DNA polymerase III subunit alpha [Bacillota bacterium]